MPSVRPGFASRETLANLDRHRLPRRIAAILYRCRESLAHRVRMRPRLCSLLGLLRTRERLRQERNDAAGCLQPWARRSSPRPEGESEPSASTQVGLHVPRVRVGYEKLSGG